MSLLDRLSSRGEWEEFYNYKASLKLSGSGVKDLRAFIDSEGWIPVCEAIRAGRPFPLPRKKIISKMSTQKKRTVYIYPHAENTVLKLLTYLLLRKYNGLFARGLYSFRPGISAKDAVRRLLASPSVRGAYSYKTDISNYFNSIPVGRLLPVLKETLSGDPELYSFLCALLSEPRVIFGGAEMTEEKGIMAGTPLSAFYANLYLMDLDRHFEEAGITYARYSDDIILFAPSREEAEAHAAFIRKHLAAAGLGINPEKELFCPPEEGWVFLGFACRPNGKGGFSVDIAPATVKKLKGKMRRKARSLRRWADRGGFAGEKAAAAFIRIFNRKLLADSGENELTWSRWFFSVINETKSLHEIDLYAQDCIRFIISGTRTKARYNSRYEDLKRLGYRSLLHEYYAFKEEESD